MLYLSTVRVHPSQNCTKVFTTFPGVRYHLLHHNSKWGSYKNCELCGKRFLGERKFERHQNKMHSAVTAVGEVEVEWSATYMHVRTSLTVHCYACVFS